ncbi:MAG: cytidine deaminase [Thaumarchaeota archaeon]|nr:cytidine deaminase [Nitrososphaerota archaeon]
MKVIPIKTSRKQTSFDLYKDLIESIKEHVLETGDIIVISSKYVANSQGRTLDVAKTRPSSDGIELAKKYQMDSKFAEIVLRESDKTLGGVTGFVLTSSDHVLAPNAGIDKSNVKKGTVILVDSRLMPARAGTVGVAIAVSGFEPVQDVRGQKDLDGNPLKVTIKATADNLATIANHKMGEGAESTPIVIIKESGTSITTRKIRNDEMAISSELCVYMRGFAN